MKTWLKIWRGKKGIMWEILGIGEKALLSFVAETVRCSWALCFKYSICCCNSHYLFITSPMQQRTRSPVPDQRPINGHPESRVRLRYNNVVLIVARWVLGQSMSRLDSSLSYHSCILIYCDVECMAMFDGTLLGLFSNYQFSKIESKK